MRVQIGRYIGDGTNPRQIVVEGLGGAPDLVLLKGGGVAIFRTSDVSGDALPLPATSNIASILALNADGFTVNDNAAANTLGTEYDYITIRDDGAGDFAHGVYVGTGDATQAQTGVGFQPDFVAIKRDAAASPCVFKTSAHVGDISSGFPGFADVTIDMPSLDADGFTVTSHARVGATGITYFWFAFKETEGVFEVGKYTGDGTDDRLIATSFKPEYVITKTAAASPPGEIRTFNFGDDSSIPVGLSVVQSNFIQRFTNAPAFQIGTSQNANGVTYYWFIFARNVLEGVGRLVGKGLVN